MPCFFSRVGLLSLSLSGLSSVFCQYGFPGSNNTYYDVIANGDTVLPNPLNTIQNATQSDEQLLAFAQPLTLEPTVVHLKTSTFIPGPSFGSNLSYSRFDVGGTGSLLQVISGVSVLVVDLRPSYPSYTGPQLTSTQFAQQGITFNTNGSVTYNISYVNLHDGLDLMHNHGQAGGWRSDGVPYLTDNPLNPGQLNTYQYTIDPKHNSGSYFVHSHYSFNSVQGMSIPLIVQNLVDAAYPLASSLNSPDITEVMMLLEDFCLVYTNADDALTSGDNYTDYHQIHDPYVCENPMLAYRAVFGEWNGEKGPKFLGYETGDAAQGYPAYGQGFLQQCMAPSLAPEFGFSFFLANDRTFDNPRLIPLAPGANVRLRVVNAARQTNYLIELPAAISTAYAIAVDGHYVKPTLLTAFFTGGTYSNNTVWVGTAQRIDIFFTMPSTPGVFPIYAFEEAPAPSESGQPAFAPFEVSYAAGIVVYSTTATPDVSNLIPQKVPGVGMLSVHYDYVSNQNQALSAWTSEITGSTLPFTDLSWTKTWSTSATKHVNVHLTGYNGIYGINFEPYLMFPPAIPLTTPTLIQPYNVNGQKPIRVSYGDRVCLTFINFNWDTHPMHLHGHSFQVVDVNGFTFQGPVRDTVLVPAGNCNNLTVCFNANAVQGGVHGLHCHMAVHEMAGMFIPVEYDGYVPITTVQPTVSTLMSAVVQSQAAGLNGGGGGGGGGSGNGQQCSSSSSSSQIAGLDAGTAIFGILFGISLVIIAILSWKLKQHSYAPATGAGLANNDNNAIDVSVSGRQHTSSIAMQ